MTNFLTEITEYLKSVHVVFIKLISVSSDPLLKFPKYQFVNKSLNMSEIHPHPC